MTKHVLIATEAPSKECPCVICGIVCVVPLRAKTQKVKCLRHREYTGQEVNPLEGVDFEELVARLQGREIRYLATYCGIELEDRIVCGYTDSKGSEVQGLREILTNDAGLETLHILSLHGGHRWIRKADIVGIR